MLAGGDAAARHPVQAAAGFVNAVEDMPALEAPPFDFPARYADALRVLRSGTRVFPTTSMGRLFDAAAALLGFTRPVTYEGQAAIWLESLARNSRCRDTYAFPYAGGELDFRPLLHAVAADRAAGRDRADIARAFHAGVARGLHDAALALCDAHDLDTVVVSGGVFQNDLLLGELAQLLRNAKLTLWTNHAVPPNDGGISLGQAALAAFGAERATGAPADAASIPATRGGGPP
jgi:hydrogenase maturation protein HypF